jgi:predicted ABC-type exoprotein transport system permease subunit
MFTFRKALELPPQLQWKYRDESELMAWTIQARNYNTFVANAMFSFMATVILGAALIMYSVYEGMSQPWRTSSCAFFFFLMVLVLLSVTHQRMNFAYRFTQSGLECCEWKDFPKWAISFLKWFSGATVIILIYLATIDPTYLIGALMGPGGMGLMYLSMMHSENYRNMHTQYHHLTYEWKDFTQLAIATNREVVDLKYSHFDVRLGRIVNWNENIFCKRKQKEAIANLIKPYLSPGVPFIKAKVNVPMSTD